MGVVIKRENAKILGIDLGLKGYACLLNLEDRSIDMLYPLPITDSQTIDTLKWGNFITDCINMGVVCAAAEQIFVTIQMKHVVTFATNVGRVLGEIERQCIPLVLYPPVTWQKDLGFVKGNPTKPQALALARELWPTNKWTNHNAADASLIAYYQALQLEV